MVDLRSSIEVAIFYRNLVGLFFGARAEMIQVKFFSPKSARLLIPVVMIYLKNERFGDRIARI